jgi:hypothetical protein
LFREYGIIEKKKGEKYMVRRTITAKTGLTPEQLEEIRALGEMPDEEINLDDEDCPPLSPAMMKQFRCAVIMRNRAKRSVKNGKADI